MPMITAITHDDDAQREDVRASLEDDAALHGQAFPRATFDDEVDYSPAR